MSPDSTKQLIQQGAIRLGFDACRVATAVPLDDDARRLESWLGKGYAAGMDWIENTSMTDILVRHYPTLREALRGTDNAFAPWPGSRA